MIKSFGFKLSPRFVRFLFVGMLNTFFGYTVFALFIFLNFHYAAAALLSTILSILFNFKTTGTIVFNNSKNKLIFRFVGIYTLMYFVTIIELKLFLLAGFNNMYINSAIWVFPNALCSYLLMKKIVFKDK